MSLACRAFSLRTSSSTRFGAATSINRQSFNSYFCRANIHFTAPRPAPGRQKIYTKLSDTTSPWFLLFTFTASAGATYSALSYFNPVSKDADNMAAASQIPMPAKINGDSLHAQLVSTAKTQPAGRPGNLTAEETAKLKEFWGKLLEVFGKYKPQPVAAAAAEAPAAEKKKSGGGFFGRKAAEPVDSNDKHGGNKAYQQALDTMSPEELETEFYKMIKQDSPDASVLRYLRARKWDTQAALVMLVSTLHWRAKDMQVDDLVMFEGEAGAIKASKDNTDPAAKKEGEDFMAQLKMGKSFAHEFDKSGRPINVVRVRLHHGGEQTVTSIERFTIYLIETIRFMIKPHESDTGVSSLDDTYQMLDD